MRMKSIKVFLPILCAIALLCSSCGALSAVGISSSDTNGDGRVTVPEILARDGYLEGVWYPWFTHTYLGSGLAPNPDVENRDQYGANDYWQDLNKVGIDEYGVDKIKQEIFNLKALGYNTLCFEGSCWGEGTIHDENTGDVTGIQSEYLTNVRRFLDICREVDMPVVWTVCFHTSVAPTYFNLDAWYFVCQMYSNPTITQNYCDKFVRPLCDVLNEYPDVVLMTVATVEIENETNDSQLGNHFDHDDRETYGVTQDDCVNFVRSVTNTLKEEMPETWVTVATNTSNFAMYADCNFDMVGRNQYSSSANALDMSNYYVTAPLLATEWGLGDGYNPSESDFSTGLANFRTNFKAKGYTGWFQWCWQPSLGSTTASGNTFLKKQAQTVYDFREGMYDMYYAMEADRVAFNSSAHVSGKPSMFYHDGANANGTVYWIQPKNVSTYTVEKSTDGGSTWTAVSGTATIDTTTGSHRYMLTDSNPTASGKVQYRVTVNGKTSYSNVWNY